METKKSKKIKSKIKKNYYFDPYGNPVLVDQKMKKSGEFRRLSPYYWDTVAPWLEGPEELDPWFNALAIFDRANDVDPLVDILVSSAPPAIAPHIWDLFDRYKLTPKHKRRTPSYDLSRLETRIYHAANLVRILADTNLSLSERISEAATTFGLSEQQVRSAYEGKRGSSRKKRHLETIAGKKI